MRGVHLKCLKLGSRAGCPPVCPFPPCSFSVNVHSLLLAELQSWELPLTLPSFSQPSCPHPEQAWSVLPVRQRCVACWSALSLSRLPSPFLRMAVITCRAGARRSHCLSLLPFSLHSYSSLHLSLPLKPFVPAKPTQWKPKPNGNLKDSHGLAPPFLVSTGFPLLSLPCWFCAVPTAP